MFGLRIVTRRGLGRIRARAYNDALGDIVAMLRNRDAIYLEPVTLVGDYATIQNCAFLGEQVALTIKTTASAGDLVGLAEREAGG